MCSFINCDVCNEILNKKSYNKHIQSKKHLTNKEKQKLKTQQGLNKISEREIEPERLAKLYSIMHS